MTTPGRQAAIEKLREAVGFLRSCNRSGEDGADHPLVLEAVAAYDALAEQPREHGPDHPTHKHPRVPGEPYCACFEHGFHVCAAEHWAVLCGEINYERRVAEQEGFSGRQAAVDWLLTTDIHAQGSESARRDFARRTVDRILALTT